MYASTRSSQSKKKTIKTLFVTLVVLATISTPTTVSLASSISIPQEPVSLNNLLGTHDRDSGSAFRFVLATDSHIGSGQGNKNSALAIRDIQSTYKDSSFMIHMGDVTETGSEEEYSLFQNMTSLFTFPIVGTAGNHESRWQDPFATKFSDYLSPSNFSFDWGKWHFVVLDTTYPEQTYGTVDPSIISWLNEDLASTPKGTPIAIFSHHPIFYPATTFQDSDDALLSIIDKYPVQALFCGHGHCFIPWKHQGRACFMIGALMENCYSVVEVDGLEMKVYAIKPGTGSNDHVKSLIGEVIAEPITSFTNPIHSFQGLVKDDKLVFDFELLSPASCQFQIDGGTFSDLGSLPAGMHQFSVDVSAHAPGLHTIRLKATGTDGPYTKVLEFEKDLTKYVAWKLDLGSALTGRLLRNSTESVIFGTRNGSVYAVHPETGSLIWQYNAGSSWCGGAIADQELYFGTSSGEVHCIDKATGAFIWKESIDPLGFIEPPAITRTGGKTLLYIGSPSGKIYAIDTSTKATAWVYEAIGAVTNTPSTGLGMVFFGTWGNKFYALDAKTGQLRWERELGRQIYYSPSQNSLLLGGKVFASTPADKHSGGSFVYALNPYDGTEVWKGVNSRTFLEPTLPLSSNEDRTIVRKYVLVPDSSGLVTSYFADSGQIPWRIQGYSTLFSGVPNLDEIYVTGGARGVIAIHLKEKQVDYKVRDCFLFVDPLVVKVQSPDNSDVYNYLIIQGDNKGDLWAIRAGN
jgi:outer membrane protein assembly factor BamB